MAATIVVAARPRHMELGSLAAAARMTGTYVESQAPVVKTGVAYAGFWRRVLAYLIDQVFLLGIELALYWGLWVTVPNSLQAIQGGSLQTLEQVAPVVSAITWAYFGIFESSPARATLGKLALGLYVGDVYGDPITFRRAVWRNWLKILSWLTLGLGFVLAGFTPRKQAVHDLAAATLVLRKVRYFELGTHAPTEPGDHWDGTRWVASVPPVENA